MGAMQHQRWVIHIRSIIFLSSDEASERRRKLATDLGKDKIMNLARSFNTWRKYRQTCNELGRMSDRELTDLGIGRSDIPQVARRAVK